MKATDGLRAPSQDSKFLQFFIVAQIMKEILFLFLYENLLTLLHRVQKAAIQVLGWKTFPCFFSVHTYRGGYACLDNNF